MSKYTQFDWASDRMSREQWADDEERMIGAIDRSMRRSGRKGNKSNKKNHRNYA